MKNQQVNINQAVSAMQQGDVIAYPTEAVWGLGCDPFQEQAFQKILQLKQRPIEKGVILLASDLAQIEFLFHDLSKNRYQEVIDSWLKPQINQATTWLFPRSSHIPDWIVGQHSQVAVRLTQHAISQQLCRSLGHFIVSTSANPSGLAPAQDIQQAFDYFGENIYYVAGELGGFNQPSRIIDAVSGKILRA